VDNTATNFVCFLIINALSFFFLKYFLKFLIALRVDYTSDKENYREMIKRGNQRRKKMVRKKR
ncbi:hypothetical protein LK536_19730, partial [Lachnoclostridium pacaense]|uniref:hypothetical protein n=1 Tax=Enterocloster hominis (ex Hitch et al. 2024) TaxID=1917870 RepID=UPI001D11919C